MSPYPLRILSLSQLAVSLFPHCLPGKSFKHSFVLAILVQSESLSPSLVSSLFLPETSNMSGLSPHHIPLWLPFAVQPGLFLRLIPTRGWSCFFLLMSVQSLRIWGFLHGHLLLYLFPIIHQWTLQLAQCGYKEWLPCYCHIPRLSQKHKSSVVFH